MDMDDLYTASTAWTSPHAIPPTMSSTHVNMAVAACERHVPSAKDGGRPMTHQSDSSELLARDGAAEQTSRAGPSPTWPGAGRSQAVSGKLSCVAKTSLVPPPSPPPPFARHPR
jgi:hypothetical protein